MAKKKADEAPATKPPLWPQPIPVIGLTGKYASGKTLFGLTIAPGGETLVYDTEKSSESYLSLGFDRVDVPAEMLRLKPAGYKPLDTFEWWRKHVRSIPAGRYRVILLDTVSEIEAGLADWVLAHPHEFGRTAAQYARASGLLWGDVKEHWKSILSDLASRCETFVFVAHLKAVWAGNSPTGKLAPKGKTTLEELASLYLWMERHPDAKGNVPAVPSATVRKTRLAFTKITPAGVIVSPALPPRIPEATPQAVRAYQLTPPDYDNLKPEERAPETGLSEDEKLELRARTAEAEVETERLRADRQPARSAKEIAAAKKAAAEQAEAPGAPATEPKADHSLITQEQLERLAELREELFGLDELDEEDRTKTWAGIMAKRSVKSARELTAKQARDLIEVLAFEVDKRLMERDLTTDLKEAGADPEADFPA